MGTEEACTRRSIAFVNVVPNALKHTRKQGPHAPFYSALVAGEMVSLVREKVGLRTGNKLPAAFPNANLDRPLRVYLNSQTSADLFREIIAEVYPAGTCTVFHYREHNDRDQFERMKAKMEQLPFSCVIDLAESGDA